MIEANYNDNKPNGKSYYYDSIGNILSQNNEYYGLRVGPNIDFVNNKPKKYYFYSFDNEVLFQLDYDSIGNHGILDIVKEFFFIKTYRINDTLNEYHVFNINPPKYKFDYSLVVVDQYQIVKKVLKDLTSNQVWFDFQLPGNYNVAMNEWYAIKLSVKDSINNRDCVMQKILPQ